MERTSEGKRRDDDTRRQIILRLRACGEIDISTGKLGTGGAGAFETKDRR